MAMSDIEPPASPQEMDWSIHYPEFIKPDQPYEQRKKVTMADVGCGFGGLLTTLSPLFPDQLILGIEIRAQVTKIVEKEIARLREAHKHEKPADGSPSPYNNISVLRSNIMKFGTNYFEKGQLDKMFILFADPHFKQSKWRLRVINPVFLDYYAYALKEGGILYTITDVSDLYLWQKQHLDEHPLFERIPNEELKDDPCFDAIHNGTQEGQKVTRNHGDKWAAVYRRVAYNPNRRTDGNGVVSAAATRRVDLFNDDSDDDSEQSNAADMAAGSK